MWHRHLHLKHLHLTCSQWWINEDLKINPQKVFLSIVQRWYFWNVSLGKTLRLLSLVLTEQQVQRTLTNILEVRVRVDWTDASVECMCSYNPASGESLVICDPVRSILKILEQNWENLAMVKKNLVLSWGQSTGVYMTVVAWPGQSLSRWLLPFRSKRKPVVQEQVIYICLQNSNKYI